jgi:hypothetical protein
LREKTAGVAFPHDGSYGLLSTRWRTNPCKQDRGYPATRRPQIRHAGGGTQPEIHNASGDLATTTSDVPGQTVDRCFSSGDWEPLWRQAPFYRDVLHRQNRPSEAHGFSGKPHDQHAPEGFKSGLISNLGGSHCSFSSRNRCRDSPPTKGQRPYCRTHRPI